MAVKTSEEADARLMSGLYSHYGICQAAIFSCRWVREQPSFPSAEILPASACRTRRARAVREIASVDPTNGMQFDDPTAARKLLDRPAKNRRLDGIPTKQLLSRDSDRHDGAVVLESHHIQNRRGDWTPLELFLTGIRGWEVAVRLRLDVE